MKKQAAAVFEKLLSAYDRHHSIGDITPTFCRLFGITEPECCGAQAIAPVVDHAAKIFGGEGKTERALLFCTDAMGDHQRELFPEAFNKIARAAGLRIPSVSVSPSVTPVCYGTIFTGTAPVVHGILKYEKPVLTVETIFDVFAKAGKRVAIVAVNDCSIDRIFRQRNIDYYSCRNDEVSFARTMEILESDRYDFIVSYMIGYDAAQHSFGCESPEAAAQAALAAERFEILAQTMDKYWKNFNRVLTLVPDHGGHMIDEVHGAHGTELAEDMLVSHYYRLFEKSRESK